MLNVAKFAGQVLTNCCCSDDKYQVYSVTLARASDTRLRELESALLIQTLHKFVHQAVTLSTYLASHRYLCTNSLHALIAV